MNSLSQPTSATCESHKLVETLAVAATEIKELGDTHHLLVPPGYTHIDLSLAYEKSLPAPLRMRGTIELKDLDSLLKICADREAAADAYIYADPDACSITAVFNDQRIEEGWRDHRAVFKAELTPEFARWRANSGSDKAKSQTDFAEFIEDNLADITEPAAQQLLDVATTIQATSGINFSSAKRLQDGQTQLTYSETIDARAGANGALSIPKEFSLGLRIFKNGEGYKLRARLKYRLGNGGVKFWYELDRPERAIEDAFAGYIEKVRESSYAVLIGKAG